MPTFTSNLSFSKRWVCPKDQRQALLAEFPSELIERIITYVIRDPCTTFDHLKSLRLVCRSFNLVVSRRVLSCVRLFDSGDNLVSNIRRLHAMFSSNPKGNLYMTNTLVLSWKWRYKHLSVFKSFRTMRIRNQWACGMIWNSTLAPFVYLIVALFVPRFLPLSICNLLARLHARYRLSRASVISMPNIRRVIWESKGNSGLDRMASSTVKALLEFHQLSELELLIDYNQDLSHIFKCFSKLHGLRKLRIEVRKRHQNTPNPNPINDVGKVLGANLNLTHFELFQDACSGVSFSTMFGYIPANRPLKLEHLGICGMDSSDTDSNLRAIIPHIRSLTSIRLICPLAFSRLISLLHSERIFPPIIQISLSYRPSSDMIHYLNDHPGIISFSINWYSLLLEKHILSGIVARHSKSLKYFSTEVPVFCSWNAPESLLMFLQCKKLEQLVLSSYYEFTPCAIGFLPIIANLNSSLILVITNQLVFKACIEHCHQSQNPLICDLAGRIVYEERKVWYHVTGY